MNGDEEELEFEDSIFQEISEEEEEAALADATLLDEDEDEDGFVQASVDIDDLSTGFSASLPRREIDVDEDTQGDEIELEGVDAIMTEREIDVDPLPTVHGDEVQLDLDEALTQGRTVTNAPRIDEA